MRIVMQAVIAEVTKMHDVLEKRRVVLKNVTCEAIGEAFRVEPGAGIIEFITTGQQSVWYEANLGEYVKIEINRWPVDL